MLANEEINQLAATHYKWVEQMGWHNKTVLESLALIASEFFETIDECHGNEVSPLFGEELADIFLRTADMAVVFGLDLGQLVERTPEISFSGTPVENISTILSDLGKLINSARKDVPNETFNEFCGKVVKKTLLLAEHHSVDLKACIENKMKKNLSNGTRGRRI